MISETLEKPTTSNKTKIALCRLLVLLVALTFWQLTPYLGINQFTIPQFSSVVIRLVALFQGGSHYVPGGFYNALSITLTEIAVAFAISIAIGMIVGFGIGMVKLAGRVYEPLLYLFYSAPSIVLYWPLLFIFKVGEPSKIAFGVLLGVFPLVVTLISGLRQLKPVYLKIARSMGASKWQKFSEIIVPAVAPELMGGLRLCLAYTVIGVLAGEVLGSNGGLGFAIKATSTLLQTKTTFALILFVLVMVYFFITIISVVERRYFGYQIQ